MREVLSAVDSGRDGFVEQLKELLRIPSISTDPQRAGDVRRAAEWMAAHFASLGLRAQIFDTPRHPLVYAEWLGAPGKPTVLFYGHFDVQPVDPIAEWKSDPFEPEERNGNLYGRGTSDDKGQMFTHVKAVESWFKAAGAPPVNVKFLIEGEEEIGSPNLPAWLEAHRDLLACDVIVISDTAQFGPGLPSVCTGLRGIAAFEVHVTTGSSDLHSGSFGGAVPNAIDVLTRIVAALHTPDGAVDVPGFYDEVQEPSASELASWSALPLTDEQFRKTAGTFGLYGEPGRTTLERIWARPTIEIIGIGGGYQGDGHKGVVPARAFAKFSARLVPCMDPARTIECVRRRVMSLVPDGAEVEFKAGHGTPAVSIPTDSKWVAASARALETGFGRKPVFIREGGSISIVTRFVGQYGIPCLLLGFGQPDDRIHGPNEKLSIADFHSGIRTSAALLAELASA
ncbi:MAG: dipeptidase [Candidatus Sumerlaeaceae bacterium]|nr:dipeptidase [Candidatus Sumerlaeaceae bacterium]